MNSNEFDEWMKKQGVLFCPHFEMEEKYCKYYKKELSGYTGGFCTCEGTEEDCNSCDEKKWSDDYGPIDIDWKEREKGRILVKIQRENHSITEYIKGAR